MPYGKVLKFCIWVIWYFDCQFFSIIVIKWLEIWSLWSCIWYQSSWGYWVVIRNSGIEEIGFWLWFCSSKLDFLVWNLVN